VKSHIAREYRQLLEVDSPHEEIRRVSRHVAKRSCLDSSTWVKVKVFALLAFLRGRGEKWVVEGRLEADSKRQFQAV